MVHRNELVVLHIDLCLTHVISKCWFDSDRRLQVPEHIGDLNCTVSVCRLNGIREYQTTGRTMGELQLTIAVPASGKVLKTRLDE